MGKLLDLTRMLYTKDDFDSSEPEGLVSRL